MAQTLFLRLTNHLRLAETLNDAQRCRFFPYADCDAHGPTLAHTARNEVAVWERDTLRPALKWCSDRDKGRCDAYCQKNERKRSPGGKCAQKSEKKQMVPNGTRRYHREGEGEGEYKKETRKKEGKRAFGRVFHRVFHSPICAGGPRPPAPAGGACFFLSFGANSFFSKPRHLAAFNPVSAVHPISCVISCPAHESRSCAILSQNSIDQDRSPIDDSLVERERHNLKKLNR